MAGRGRPSQYDPKYAEALDAATPEDYGAATIHELGEFLKVKYSAISRWMEAHPEFKEAVMRAREQVDDNVENALLRTAKGFTVKLNKQRVTKDGDVIDTVDEVHVPPNPAAAQFWLKNRRPARWQDKQIVQGELSGSFVDLVEKHLAARAKERGQ